MNQARYSEITINGLPLPRDSFESAKLTTGEFNEP